MGWAKRSIEKEEEKKRVEEAVIRRRQEGEQAIAEQAMMAMQMRMTGMVVPGSLARGILSPAVSSACAGPLNGVMPGPSVDGWAAVDGWGGCGGCGCDGCGGWDSLDGLDGMEGKGRGKGKGKDNDSRRDPRKPSGPNLPRERVGEETVYGEVVEWKGRYGWIQPSEPVRHRRIRQDGRIYLSIQDIKNASEVREGKNVAFYVYCDQSGLGAEEVLCC